MIGGMCVCVCMSVLCLRGGCIICVTFPALAFSYLFGEDIGILEIKIRNLSETLIK